MKRKKWSELEEQSLLTKYAELLRSGVLSKLKTREKKFKPIADHVNSLHHFPDPVIFPFKWSWRDVSIKVQNMRHQYLGVKQKIQVSKDEFNWKDGEIHWENFLKYKEVFGDIELDHKGKKSSRNVDVFGRGGDLGFEIDCEDLEDDDDDDDGEEEDEEDEEEEEEEEGKEEEEDTGDVGHVGEGMTADNEGEFRDDPENGDVGLVQKRKLKNGSGLKRKLGLVGTQVLELRNVLLKREEKRREREFRRENNEAERERKSKEVEYMKKRRKSEREEWLDKRELELDERQSMWARREYESRVRLERRFDEERQRRMRFEDKREKEEMEWRERMLSLQIEHEKQMMQMHAEACQNQMQILGLMSRLLCQHFGSMNDGFGGGMGTLTSQMLQNLHHPGGLGDSEKPDANSPSEFI